MIKLTEQDKKLKLMLADKMLEEIPKMDLKELKENYEYMLLDDVFLIKYKAYTKEQLDSFTESTVENLRKYFKLGMNMYKVNVKNCEFFDVL